MTSGDMALLLERREKGTEEVVRSSILAYEGSRWGFVVGETRVVATRTVVWKGVLQEGWIT